MGLFVWNKDVQNNPEWATYHRNRIFNSYRVSEYVVASKMKTAPCSDGIGAPRGISSLEEGEEHQ